MLEIPPYMVVLLACSKDKQPNVTACAAGELYTGQLFRKGKAIAQASGIPFFILSAKYGFLKPTTVVETYDTKFKTPYAGPFPPEPWHGFYLGGELYFKHAPMRFERLVPRGAIGEMLGSLSALQRKPADAELMIAAHIARYPA